MSEASPNCVVSSEDDGSVCSSGYASHDKDSLKDSPEINSGHSSAGDIDSHCDLISDNACQRRGNSCSRRDLPSDNMIQMPLNPTKLLHNTEAAWSDRGPRTTLRQAERTDQMDSGTTCQLVKGTIQKAEITLLNGSLKKRSSETDLMANGTCHIDPHDAAITQSNGTLTQRSSQTMDHMVNVTTCQLVNGTIDHVCNGTTAHECNGTSDNVFSKTTFQVINRTINSMANGTTGHISRISTNKTANENSAKISNLFMDQVLNGTIDHSSNGNSKGVVGHLSSGCTNQMDIGNIQECHMSNGNMDVPIVTKRLAPIGNTSHSSYEVIDQAPDGIPCKMLNGSTGDMPNGSTTYVSKASVIECMTNEIVDQVSHGSALHMPNGMAVTLSQESIHSMSNGTTCQVSNGITDCMLNGTAKLISKQTTKQTSNRTDHRMNGVRNHLSKGDTGHLLNEMANGAISHSKPSGTTDCMSNGTSCHMSSQASNERLNEANNNVRVIDGAMLEQVSNHTVRHKRPQHLAIKCDVYSSSPLHETKAKRHRKTLRGKKHFLLNPNE